MIRPAAACAATIVLAAACLPAQDATIRVDVQQVVVPVIVSDKSGRHVSGLKESDFQILEDGVPQKIVSFSGGPSSSGTYVVCVDTLHSSPAGAARVRDTLEKLFENAKPGAAQYAIIGIGRQLRVLQTVTANPIEIVAKLRSPGFLQNFGGYDGSAYEAQLGGLKRQMEEFCRHCACSARQAPTSCNGEIVGLKQSVDAEASQWIPLTHAMLDQFRSVVDELAKIGTSRTLILVSDGFELDPKREFYKVISQYLPGRPEFQSPEASDATLSGALKVASDKNIRIDAIDSRAGSPAPAPAEIGPMDAGAGIAAGNTTSILGTNRGSGNAGVRSTSLGTASIQPIDSTQETSESMARIASLTGGVYSHGGDLSKEFRGAMGDGREYYVLTYTPSNTARDGAFRHIGVETANKKLTIRAKSGYWAPAAAQ
ncbi:MAG: VWA domain-containing protein [Acidobacteriota bacterium]|nr:VWA domain-containing protein [Acidobacteriota bacterium]